MLRKIKRYLQKGTRHTRKIEQAPQEASLHERGAEQVRQAGFWFVDIPRTSSSSIKAELGRRFGPGYGKSNPVLGEHVSQQLFEDHIPAERMRQILGEKSWDALYTFTFVRNPFDRVQSLYHYLKKFDEIPERWDFTEFIQRLVDADDKTPYLGYHGLRYDASDFILDQCGNILVDDVFRYEDRNAGIKSISEKIGFPELGQLHILNASPKDRNYRELYNDASRELVSKRFAKDIELFDYSF